MGSGRIAGGRGSMRSTDNTSLLPLSLHSRGGQGGLFWGLGPTLLWASPSRLLPYFLLPFTVIGSTSSSAGIRQPLAFSPQTPEMF